MLLNLRNILKGILATATMDFLSGSTYKMGLIAPLSPHLIGRWFASVARGQILLKDVAEVPPVARTGNRRAHALRDRHHFGACLFVNNPCFRAHPTQPSCSTGFGVSTTLLPWLIMFPAMGYGYFATHGPEGNMLFLSSLITRTVIAAGGIADSRGIVAASLLVEQRCRSAQPTCSVLRLGSAPSIVRL